jgi:hypothetical protein
MKNLIKTIECNIHHCLHGFHSFNSKQARGTRHLLDAAFLGAMLTVALMVPAAAVSQSSLAPVNLGKADNFAILAKAGISTTGTTSITGDIGVSPASATFVTGFGLIMDASGTFSTSSLVNGKIYAADYTAPTSANLITAVLDMQTAYTDAAGRTLPDYTELYAGDVTGKILTPGLYKWGTGVQISAGGVTISGSATDVWIFQVAQNLNVANAAIVTLSGGALASNIFWQVAGHVTLGTTAVMKGNILCQTQIQMNTGAMLNGRALAQTSVTLDANTVTRPTVVVISPPIITSFAPTSGPIGTTVTITGSNFNPISTNNVVYFGAVKGIVTSGTNIGLTVTVPTGATYAPISVTDTTTHLTAYLSSPFIVTFPSSRILDATSFESNKDFSTDQYPKAAVVTDFDGDGKSDIVVAQDGITYVAIFHNTSSTGKLSFDAKQDVSVGNYPSNIAVGDIDGDGYPDLITASTGAQILSVFRNTSTLGTISFASRVDISVVCAGMAIGDIDGDGKPDIVVSNPQAGKVSILRNTTVGSVISFAPPVDFIVPTNGSTPFSVTLGDIDGDGKVDVITPNFDANSVSVLRNTSTSGSISFAARADFATGSRANAAAVADIDGDGKLDIVVANALSNSISIFHNTSFIGAVSFAGKSDINVGTYPSNVTVVDLDGDGRPDLAVNNQNGNSISLLKNISSVSTISFSARQDIAISTSPMNIAIGDLDNDSKPDLITVNYSSNSLSLFRNIITTTSIPTITSFMPLRNALNIAKTTTITVTFSQDINSSTLTNSTIKINGSISGPHTATYNYNSFTKTVTITPNTQFKAGDVVTVTATRGIRSSAGDSLASAGSCSFTIKAGIGSGQFVQSSTPGVGNLPNSVTAGDFNGDGALDLAVTNTSSSSVSILLNNGSGIFTQSSTPGVGSGPNSVTAGDFNGDGAPDLAVANQSSNTVSILLNNGSGVFTQSSTPNVGSSPYSIITGDFNNDGALDLAVANTGSNTVSILLNNGSGGFAQSSTPGVGSGPISVTAGDFNGDGALDLAVTNKISNTVSILLNNGSGIFTQSSTTSVGSYPWSVTAGDFNGDGALDLAVTNQNSNTVSFLLNNGSGVFTQSSTLSVGNYPQSVTAGDFNGDGALDLAVANTSSSSVSILLNNGSGVFTQSSTLSVGVGPRSVTAGDFNGDGALDLTVANYSSNNVSILLNGVPVTPQNLTAIAGNGQVTLKWKKNTEADFLKYCVYMGTDSVTMVLKDSSTASITDTTKTITGLTNGTKYYFRVSALDSARSESAKSIAASATPLSTIKILGEYTADANTVLLLHMDETSGSTVSDASGQNNNGSATGTTIAAGKFGSARNFLTPIDLVTVNNSAIINPATGPFSAEVWFRSSDPGSYIKLLTKGSTYGLQIETVAGFARVYATGSSDIASRGSIIDGKWHHLALVRNATLLTFYIDGVIQSSVTNSANLTSTDTIVIGSQIGETNPRSSFIDEVRISNIARSPQEFNLQLPPKNVTASVVGGGSSIQLNWANGGGAVPLMRYRIYSGTDSTNVILKDSTTNLTFTSPPQTPGMYFARVAAVDSTGFEGAKSWATSATTFSTAPAAPRNLTATAGNAQVTLKWNKNTEADFLRYRIYLGLASGVETKLDSTTAGITDTTKTISSVVNGTTYYFTVTAVNTSGQESVFSNEVTALPSATIIVPLAPGNLVAIAASSTTIHLTWADMSNNEDIFKIQRSVGNNTNYLDLFSPPSNTTSYDDAALIPNTLYYYKIRAYNTAGNSNWSNEASATTPTPIAIPQNLTAMVGNSQVTLKWNKNTEADFLRYCIYRGTSSNPTTKVDSTIAGITDTTKIITSLTNGTMYYFRITAVDNAGLESGYSNEVNATPSGSSGTLLYSFDQATTDARFNSYTSTGGSVSLSQNTTLKKEGTSSVQLNYTVKNAETWGGSVGIIYTLASPVTQYIDLSNATALSVWVYNTQAASLTSKLTFMFRLFDAGGSATYAGDVLTTEQWEFIKTGVFDLTPGWNQITMPLVDCGSGTVAITDQGFSSPDGLVDTKNNGVLDKNKIVGWSIDALTFTSETTTGQIINGIVLFDQLEVVQQTSSTVPTAPTTLTASAASSSQINLNWTDNSSNEDGSIIERSTNNFATYNQIATVATNAATYQDYGLTVSTQYFYRVRAYNSAGNSNYSNVANATPSVAADITLPVISNINVMNTPVYVNNTGMLMSSPPQINATATDVGSGMREMKIAYRSFGETAWSYSQVFTGSSINNFTIPTSPNKFSYGNKPVGVNFRVGAWDNAGNVYWSPYNSIDVQLDPQVTDQPNFSMPAASQSSNKTTAYRMISVPYDLTNKQPVNLLSNFGSHSENNVSYVRWRFQQYVNGQYQDYDQFSQTNAVIPGAAFFFIVRDQGSQIVVQGASVVRSDVMYNTGISLQSGWNLVGNPFNIPYPIDSLVFYATASTVPQPIRQHAYYSGTGPIGGWDTTSASVSQIQPWSGIAAYVNSAGTLKFPSAGQRSGLPKTSRVSSVPPIEKEAVGNWTLAVNAYRSDIDMRCEGSSLGMAQGANEGDDPYDSYIPPIVGDKNVAVYFRNADGAMMRDIRPLNEDGDVWEMRVVTGDAGAKVKLQWGDKLNLPNPAFEAYLIDTDQKMAHNLKEVQSLEINSGNGMRNFRVVVGKKSYVTQNNAGVALTPSSMKLYANYPNPFNPETVIRYTVPDASASYTVTLKIFNVLGQEIATLVNGQKSAGYYEVKWNALQQSSGIYFYRLSITDGSKTFQDIKKMVLMK